MRVIVIAVVLGVGLACGAAPPDADEGPPPAAPVPPPSPAEPLPELPAVASRSEGDVTLYLVGMLPGRRIDIEVGSTRIRVPGSADHGSLDIAGPFEVPGRGRVDPAVGWPGAMLDGFFGTEGESVRVEVIDVDRTLEHAALRVRYFAPRAAPCQYPGLEPSEGIRLALAPIDVRGPACEGECLPPNWVVYTSVQGSPYEEPDLSACTDEPSAARQLAEAKAAFGAAGIDPAHRIPVVAPTVVGDRVKVTLPSGVVDVTVQSVALSAAQLLDSPDLLSAYASAWIAHEDPFLALAFSTAHGRRVLHYPPRYERDTDPIAFSDDQHLPILRESAGHEQISVLGAFEVDGKAIVILSHRSQGRGGSDPIYTDLRLVGPIPL